MLKPPEIIAGKAPRRRAGLKRNDFIFYDEKDGEVYFPILSFIQAVSESSTNETTLHRSLFRQSLLGMMVALSTCNSS